MTLADLEIVGIMRRGDFHHTGAEFRIDIVVGDNRHLAIHNRQDDRLADEFLVALIVGVDRQGGIAKHRLRTSGGHGQILVRAFDLVADIPEVRIDLFAFDFVIGKRCQASRAPVDEPIAAIDQPFVVKTYENLDHGLGQALIHGEAGSFPVARAADTLQLIDDRAEFLLFPGPDAFEKLLAADFLARDALLGQALFDHHLGGDTGMIDARHPLGLVSHASVSSG